MMFVLVIGTTFHLTSCNKDDETEEIPTAEQNDFAYYGRWSYFNENDDDVEGIEFKKDNTISFYINNNWEGSVEADGTFKVEGDEVVASFTKVEVWPEDETFKGFINKTPVTVRFRIQKNTDGTLTIYNSITKNTHIFEIEEN